ncbi:hypothetical protein HUZ94_06295 [Cronobacter sakazakii]|uniref:hypothetical protein n=1 Tax=Cronobacter sakazakii TaxID=28141 RepID=UPI0015880BE4|nr:hypothetical protein [Cronobacter sakazakii]NUW63194.1 hypothetical protein [Cronobacter sakazakii]
MELIIALCISFLFYLMLSLVYRKIGINLSGDKIHPFALSVIIQFCIFSLPGVIIISFLGYSSARYYGISDANRLSIGLWYVYSLIVYFLTFFILAGCFKIKNYNKYAGIPVRYVNNIVYIRVALLLSIVFLAVKLFFSKKAPIFYLLEGDFSGAYAARVDIQTNPQLYYIPYFSNLISLLLIFQFYFIFYFYIFADKKSWRMTFFTVISFCIAATECLYETQKAPIIFLMFGALFIVYLRKSTIMKIAVPVGGVAFIVILLQAIVSGSGLEDGFNSAADRFLLGQNQGFYHIINSIIPDSKYWYTNFYFIERFGIQPARADVDVIPYLNYVAGLDIVNVNSYYLGEAWSMLGYGGLIIAPFIVAAAMFAFVKCLDVLIGFNPLFFIPYSIYIIPELRINQSFTYFLYGKDFVFRTLMMFVLFALITAVSSLFIKRKGI